MKTIKYTALAVLMASLTMSSTALASSSKVTATNEQLVIADKYQFQSNLLDEVRQFYLHLPSGYPKKGVEYPVLIIPDGRRKMQKTVAIADDLASFGRRIPEMIVVGIETNKDRKADLSTFDSSVAFLDFITKELKPYLNSTYQTSGEYLLMGSSMGGEFVIRAMLEQPEEFDGYFSISPSVYYSDFQVVDKAIEVSKSKQVIDNKLFLSVANEGWNQGVEEFAYHLKNTPIQGLNWQFNKREKESHGSISMTQAYYDLQAYYKDWAAPHFANIQDFESRGGLNYLTDYYVKQRASVIPIGILDHMALLYVDQQNAQQAINLSELAVEHHPTSGRALRNLAVVYEKLTLLDRALTTYQKALSVAIENNHRASSIASHRQVLANFKAKHNR